MALSSKINHLFANPGDNSKDAAAVIEFQANRRSRRRPQPVGRNRECTMPEPITGSLPTFALYLDSDQENRVVLTQYRSLEHCESRQRTDSRSLDRNPGLHVDQPVSRDSPGPDRIPSEGHSWSRRRPDVRKKPNADLVRFTRPLSTAFWGCITEDSAVARTSLQSDSLPSKNGVQLQHKSLCDAETAATVPTRDW